jgi:hypothetical protein
MERSANSTACLEHVGQPLLVQRILEAHDAQAYGAMRMFELRAWSTE